MELLHIFSLTADKKIYLPLSLTVFERKVVRKIFELERERNSGLQIISK
jgi:hypothetical protein